MNPNRERLLHNGDPKSKKHILFLLGLLTSLSAQAISDTTVLAAQEKIEQALS